MERLPPPRTVDGLLMVYCKTCGDWARPDVPCPTVQAKPETNEGEIIQPLLELADNVNSPAHYKWLPVEAIEITERFNFCMGNALKYIMRADHKGNPIEDLRKSRWYIDREIARREKSSDTG